jgi:hypothetical protein
VVASRQVEWEYSIGGLGLGVRHLRVRLLLVSFVPQLVFIFRELHDVGKSRGIGPIGKGWYHSLELGRLARASPPLECMADRFLLGGPKNFT